MFSAVHYCKYSTCQFCTFSVSNSCFYLMLNVPLTWKWLLEGMVSVSRALETNFMQSWSRSWSWELRSWSWSWSSEEVAFLTLCVLYVEHNNGRCAYGTSASYTVLVPWVSIFISKRHCQDCPWQWPVQALSRSVSSMYCVPASCAPLEIIFSLHGSQLC